MNKMFRKVSFILAIIFMTSVVAPNINIAATYNTSIVYGTVAIKIGSSNALVNGAYRSVDNSNMNVVPFISSDRTMVPLRFVSEALGANVNYNPANKMITITSGNININLTSGSNVMTVNNRSITMDTAATIANDRTFVPLAYVAEAFGMNRFYNDGLIVISPQNTPVNAASDAETVKYLNSQLASATQLIGRVQLPANAQPYYPLPITPTTPTNTALTVTKIVATPETKTITNKNETSSAVKVVAYYSNLSSQDVTKQCTYESDDDDIAEVTSAYKLKSGSKKGKTEITVIYKNNGREYKDTISVTVGSGSSTSGKIERIVATPAIENFDELEDEGSEIKVMAYYSDGYSEDVTDDCDFVSKKTTIADVDDGKICSGSKEGTTTITVTYQVSSKKFEDTIKVVVDEDKKFPQLKKIAVSPKSAEFSKFNTKGSKIKVTAYYSDNTTKDVTADCNFEAEDIDVAYVTKDCELQSGSENGDIDIMVTYEEDGKESEASIAVEVDAKKSSSSSKKGLERIVSSLTEEFFTDTNKKGSKIRVIAYYTNGSSEDVTSECDFDSDDEDIAYVKNNYLYSGPDEGDTEITVEYDGEEDTIKVEVDEGGKPDRTLKKITVTPSSQNFDELDNKGKKVKVTAYYSDGDTEDVTDECVFESEDEDIAYIMSDFYIYSGDEEGEVEITVLYTYNGIEKTTTINVEVED